MIDQCRLIAGVDEVGRGPLAGPVVAAAVILNESHAIEGLGDSKALTERQRERLYSEIVTKAIAWKVAWVMPAIIDQLNILQASFLAMKRALLGLEVKPELVLIDGNQLPKDWPWQCKAIVGGDASIASISAASIVAKVVRDDWMRRFDLKYPQYQFAKHKGYPTKAHKEALKAFGPSPIHRRSFRGVDCQVKQDSLH